MHPGNACKVYLEGWSVGGSICRSLSRKRPNVSYSGLLLFSHEAAHDSARLADHGRTYCGVAAHHGLSGSTLYCSLEHLSEHGADASAFNESAFVLVCAIWVLSAARLSFAPPWTRVTV